MTAQIGNGGYSIKPKILVNNDPLTLQQAKKMIKKVRDEDEAAEEQEVGPILAVKAASSDRFRLDVLCELYETRIRQYENDPPPPDWDGVFIATTK